jgi:alpha-amylase
MFIRGGIDHAQAEKLGIKCVNADNSPNYKCALPIAHRNHKNAVTNPWKPGDKFLDWYGHESTQTGTSQGGLIAQGSAADWTTNVWPQEFGPQKTVATDGYGLEPLNTFGMHYWMLDVDMDCSHALQDSNGARWFEVKSYISNGPGWEGDIQQASTPYPSANHFAQCGKVSVFERDKNTVTFIDLK